MTFQGGSRPHVIFARNEVRIAVFDDGTQGKDLPTGFTADVEGIRNKNIVVSKKIICGLFFQSFIVYKIIDIA